MDKELFNVLAMLKAINPKDDVFYNYQTKFDEYENGKLLSAIVKQYQPEL